MIREFAEYALMRPMKESDREDFINLKLKEEDLAEITKLIHQGSIKEYLEWHFDNYLANTIVMIYKGKLWGFTGITNENLFFFLTASLDRYTSYLFVRRFREILHELMKHAGVSEVFVCVDDTYSISLEWAKRGGFVFQENDEGFEVLTYKI